MKRRVFAFLALSACGSEPVTNAITSAPPASDATAKEEPVTGTSAVETGNGQNFAAAPGPGGLRIEGDIASRYDIHLPTDLLFDFDRAELRDEARPMLAELKRHFAAHESDQVHVRGHTDAKGSDQYNYVLSMKRATALCDWLKRETRVGPTNCIGRGEAEPLRPNENADGSDNPANRQLNRRVTVSVIVYPDTAAMLDKAKRQASEGLRALDK